jgi:hypothetical protein
VHLNEQDALTGLAFFAFQRCSRFGATLASGAQADGNSSGHLGTIVSSARFNEAIKPMDEASESLLALRPMTFRYKHELDADRTPQFGLVAEEVEKVNPALVVRDADGQVNTVRYEAVNAMLLNEFVKEHRKVEQLEATAAKQQREITALTSSLNQRASQIETVSAELALRKPAPKVADGTQ